MQLKATDTIHVSNVRPEPLSEGERFELDDAAAKHLIRRGLAVEVAQKAAPKPASKPQPAPATKPAAAPKTKVAPPADTKPATGTDNK